MKARVLFGSRVFPFRLFLITTLQLPAGSSKGSFPSYVQGTWEPWQGIGYSRESCLEGHWV